MEHTRVYMPLVIQSDALHTVTMSVQKTPIFRETTKIHCMGSLMGLRVNPVSTEIPNLRTVQGFMLWEQNC